jgi:hypothetical protein
MSTTADRLRAAKALINTPDKWCKGRSRDDRGRRCLMAAILDAGGSDAPRADGPRALRDVIGPSITTWNDAPERAHGEVMAAFDRAIALAEESP